MKNIFILYLKLLGVKYTRKFSEKYFNEHPHKNNLYGISQMLSDYRVDNVGTKIEDKENDIFRIETPFIAHTQADFFLVNKIDKDKVHYIWIDKKFSVSIDEFLKIWTGFVLLAEKNEKSIEPNYKEHQKKEYLHIFQSVLLITSTLSLFVATYITNKIFTNLGLNLLLFINLIGVIIGSLLVLKQISFYGKYADKICSLFSKSGCNNVLESRAAKIFDIFGWSEIGLGYFVSNVLIILFLPHLVPLLAIFNLFTLPYLFWSVWYQKVKVKQWCPLCLATQIVLWAIFGINLFFGFLKIFNFDLINLIIAGSIYLISIFTANVLVPKLSNGRQVEDANYEINSIKSNEDVFKALLQQQPRLEVSESDSQIFLGNPNASLKVTILTNPYCNPCAGMHERVEKLLKDTNNEISIQYVLSAFEENFENVNRYLIAAYLQKDRDTANQIFKNWFEKGKELQEKFFDAFDLNIDNQDVENEHQQHKKWKEKAGLRATPTILINGYRLPNYYKIEDLIFFKDFI